MDAIFWQLMLAAAGFLIAAFGLWWFGPTREMES